MANIQGFEVSENNTEEILRELNISTQRALTIIGMKAERYAKALCPVGTPESTGIKGYRGGTLRNSITFATSEKTVTIGSNVEYAPYVELGTGPQFEAPPEWEKFDAPRGSGRGRGMKPRHFLRDAIQNHIDEFQNIIAKEVKS